MNLNPALSALIKLALLEDAPSGDLTSSLCLKKDAQANATLIAREDLIVCGLPIIEFVLNEIGSKIAVELCFNEGQAIKANTTIALLTGNAYEILLAERTILNFLQRLSGVASHTRKILTDCGSLTILDTRKTIPGWRYLDKYAVVVGGAKNHRANLSEMVLIKDTHIAAVGSIDKTLKRVFDKKPVYTPVEVEVRNRQELEVALAYPVTAVMLDNMNVEAIRKSLELIRTKCPELLVEVSGGISEKDFAELMPLSPLHISMGRLTTQAKNSDISMKVSNDQLD